MSRPSISFEFFPPRTDEQRALLEGTWRKLAPLRPDYLSVTFGAGGSTREGSFEMVDRLKNERGLPTVAYLAGVDAGLVLPGHALNAGHARALRERSAEGAVLLEDVVDRVLQLVANPDLVVDVGSVRATGAADEADDLAAQVVPVTGGAAGAQRPQRTVHEARADHHVVEQGHVVVLCEHALEVEVRGEGGGATQQEGDGQS